MINERIIEKEKSKLIINNLIKESKKRKIRGLIFDACLSTLLILLLTFVYFYFDYKPKFKLAVSLSILMALAICLYMSFINSRYRKIEMAYYNFLLKKCQVTAMQNRSYNCTRISL